MLKVENVFIINISYNLQIIISRITLINDTTGSLSYRKLINPIRNQYRHPNLIVVRLGYFDHVTGYKTS